ncbi:septum formation protein Maf [Leptospira ognonensis]|uniref:dTTP/UTP pyrophosphatase n=1 Tax=Leptospira ognonensis TaxID=2484945 RepID=A0A4R9KAZ2_9LEPT|nr:nucleoside triphosphate pyrophosphatase [Leptospira ognonensis]TGL63171.1 septum formation protein Maf [Leptospira ognonensis]
MFILKSRSPRRIEILKNLGFQFQIDPEDIDEAQLESETHLDYLERVVTSKLGETLRFSREDFILACDTIVVLEGAILHKPSNEWEAMTTLRQLNGKSHSVFSGCILFHKGTLDYFFEETRIFFKSWSEEQIKEYIQRCLPYDKAGAYGIQDERGPVLRWEGSYQNVMGFPIRSFLSRNQIWKSAWS